MILASALMAGCTATVSPAPSGGKPSAQPSAQPSGSTPTNQFINGCTSYEDRTNVDADHMITWDLSVSSQSERCMKIKAGQSVTFMGNFTAHPLMTKGGSTPSPFDDAANQVANPGLTGQEGTSLEFKTAGTFGYVCKFHPSMTGAILVVP
ncbi:MAG TPA: plastocyanin/azurin family copper-binding protein [Candidatus Obscuribacterales bacterium]